MTATTLHQALATCTMVVIDTLHAFDFSVDEQNTLHIECMDGRELKRWQFTAAQVEAATFDASVQHWHVQSHTGLHHIACLDAFSPAEDETDPQ